jgi:hypothetical protein
MQSCRNYSHHSTACFHHTSSPDCLCRPIQLASVALPPTIGESQFLNKATAVISSYRSMPSKATRNEIIPPPIQGWNLRIDICAKLRKLADDLNSSNSTSQPHAKTSPEPSLTDPANLLARSHKGECLSDHLFTCLLCSPRSHILAFKNQAAVSY